MEGKNATIGFFSHTPSGCNWYRIEHPMKALASSGVPTFKISINEDVPIDEISTFQVYGIYPFSFEKALKYFKEIGKKIIYDVDDAVDWIDPTNPFYFSVKRDTGSQTEILKYVDHITVSTNKMAEYMSLKTDKPITIIPNCYIQDEWTAERRPHQGIRIGFAGSPTHIEDLNIVLPAIKNLKSKYDITLVIMGFGIDDYETTLRHIKFASPPEGREQLERFEMLLKDLPFEWIPNVDTSLYPKMLTELSLDIGLCPLKSTPFNDARSASKAMEYTLSGALALASDVEAYRNDLTSILVKDDKWESAIEKYILDKESLNVSRLSALHWLQQHRNMETQVDLLKSVYVV